ncbi:MAG: hypothetical protein QXJ21_09940, partial [Thermofilum sp.]
PSLADFLQQEMGVLRAQPLRDVVGQKLLITAVEFHNIGGREAVVLVTASGQRYYSFSRVVIKQARVAEEVIKRFRGVWVTPKRVKNYYTLG